MLNRYFSERLNEHQKAVYRAVKNNRPDLYERVVRIAHLSLVGFGGRDELQRAAMVEAAIMSLVAELTEIEP